MKKIRKTQEEQVIEMLKREGFQELKKKEIEREPYKSIYTMPECFREDDKQAASKLLSKQKEKNPCNP